MKCGKRKAPIINNWYFVPNDYIKTWFKKGRWVDRLCGVIEQDRFEASVLKSCGNGLIKTTQGWIRLGIENINLNRNTEWS